MGQPFSFTTLSGNNKAIITTMPVGTECNKFPIGAECRLKIVCSMQGKGSGIPTRGINGPDISEITEDNCFVIGEISGVRGKESAPD